MQSQADFFPLRVLYPSPSRPKMNLGRAQKIRKSDGCGFSALHRSSYAPSLSGHGKYSAAVAVVQWRGCQSAYDGSSHTTITERQPHERRAAIR